MSLETGRLWEKKKKKIGCCYAESPSQRLSLFFFSHRLALHPSLSLYLPSLSTEREFSETPRLNFLAVLGGCLSSPGSPAHKPPPQQQLGQWLSHKPSAPSLPFCQANDFCRHLQLQNWLAPRSLSLHSNLSYPTENGFILAAKAGFLSLLFVRWQKLTQGTQHKECELYQIEGVYRT